MRGKARTELLRLASVARHRVSAGTVRMLVVLTGATANAAPLRRRARRARVAAGPRPVRPRSGRSRAERAWVLALQAMPVAVLAGWLMAAAAGHDDRGALALSTRSTEHETGSNTRQSTSSGVGGGPASSGAPVSATVSDGQSRRASEQADPAVPAESAEAAGAQSGVSQSLLDVVIPEHGVQIPWFDVSLPRIGVELAWDSDPERAAVAAPAPAPAPAAGTHGTAASGPVPVVLLLASLGCLAAATFRRIRVLRRRAGRLASRTAAEADHASPPAETNEPDLTARPAASPPQPTAPEREHEPLAEPETEQEPLEPERGPRDALTARTQTGVVSSAHPAPDESGPGVRAAPVTGVTPPVEATIIRARKQGRIRR